jgi:hypothetical protein
MYKTPLGFGIGWRRIPRVALRLPWALSYNPFGVPEKALLKPNRLHNNEMQGTPQGYLPLVARRTVASLTFRGVPRAPLISMPFCG